MERLLVCHASRINQTASLDSGRRSPATNLPHEGQQVGDPPMIGNLSVLYAHHIDRLKLDFAVGRSNSKIRALVGSVMRCVIDKIICEELVEDFELPLALNFLCVSAHD